MFTDMVGYTALGQKNEKMSLALVEDQRRLIRPILSRHNGREVKTLGDALLVEFVSAVEAVNCAVEIQSVLREANRSITDERKMIIRIGIHLGDVVHQGRDVAGDAVNVASRIEPLSPPGGVSVSAQVYTSVVNKVEYDFESLGVPELKNVTTPIEVFRVSGVGEAMARPKQKGELLKERIAVLPLANMSPDPDDDYFAEGLTEELIHILSKIRELSVISRTSTLQYKSKTKSVIEIGKELRVGTILEGSVRKDGNKVRISIQMIEASDDRHVWSEEYDRELRDIFTIQTDIARQVAAALRIQLASTESRDIERRPTTSIQAYQSYLRGAYCLTHFRSKEDLDEALKHFQEAIALDSNCAMAYAGISQYHHLANHSNWLSPDDAYPKMREFAARALEIDPSLAEAHGALGAVYFHYEWKWEDAEREFKRAIELRPNYAAGFDMYQYQMAVMGRFDESNELIERGAELSPRWGKGWGMQKANALLYLGKMQKGISLLEEFVKTDPVSARFHSALGFSYFRASRVQQGISELRRALALSKGDLSFKADLGLLLGLSGEAGEAGQILTELTEASKTYYVSMVKMACIKYTLGKEDEAFEDLERACEGKEIELPDLRLMPELIRLRSDPRWISIERKMGLRPLAA